MPVCVYRGKKGDQEYLAVNSLIDARPYDEARIYEVRGEKLTCIRSFIDKGSDDSLTQLKEWGYKKLDLKPGKGWWQELSIEEALALKDQYPVQEHVKYADTELNRRFRVTQLFERVGEIRAIEKQFSNWMRWKSEDPRRAAEVSSSCCPVYYRADEEQSAAVPLPRSAATHGIAIPQTKCEL